MNYQNTNIEISIYSSTVREDLINLKAKKKKTHKGILDFTSLKVKTSLSITKKKTKWS